MFRQRRTLRGFVTVVTSIIGLCLTAAIAQAQLSDCPLQHDSTEAFTNGAYTVEFRNSARYETVTFIADLGTPSIPRSEEVKALSEAVKQAKLGTVLQGLSMRKFGTVLIRLSPGISPDAELARILGRNAVAGRDRARGIGNPIYDAGDVDHILVNQIVVQFRADAGQDRISALLARYCARIKDRRERTRGWRYVLTFDGKTARHALAMANRLNKEAIVEFAQPDYVVIAAERVQSGPTAGSAPDCPAAQPTSSVDPYFSKQWYLDQSSDADINAPKAWGVTQGENIVIAILDDAVETTHEDLSDKIHSKWNAITGNDDLGITNEDKHGTPVAGIAAAMTGNAHGIKGTAPKVKLMPVRVMQWVLDVDETGEPIWESEYQYSHIADGVEFAAASADVISMSISLGAYDSWYHPEIEAVVVDAALIKGRVLVFAAGNDSAAYVVFPARMSATTPVLAVGATDDFDKVISTTDWGSNYGAEISVVAPGTEIVTTDRTGSNGYCSSGNYVQFGGTSAATPIVAGVAALVQSQYMAQGLPLLSPQQVKERIQDTATVPLNPYLPSATVSVADYYGHGRVDACKALQQGSCPKPYSWWRWLILALALVAVVGVSRWLWLVTRRV